MVHIFRVANGGGGGGGGGGGQKGGSLSHSGNCSSSSVFMIIWRGFSFVALGVRLDTL